MLNIGAGDKEEHAIFLCNLFLGIGLKSFVVLGHAIPGGKVAFVLSKDENSNPHTDSRFLTNQLKLHDPVSGETWSMGDENCPLKQIGCVFDNKDVKSIFILFNFISLFICICICNFFFIFE